MRSIRQRSQTIETNDRVLGQVGRQLGISRKSVQNPVESVEVRSEQPGDLSVKRGLRRQSIVAPDHRRTLQTDLHAKGTG